MRWGRILALTLVLCVATLGRADEDDADDDMPAPAKSGNWFTRLFKPGTRKQEPRKQESRKQAASQKENAQDTPAKGAQAKQAVLIQQAVNPAILRERYRLEWQRRAEVCLKLREIALQTGDKELEHKADDLDTRAWDTFVQKTSSLGGRPLSPDEQILQQKLALESQRRLNLQAGAAVDLDARAAKE